jgi:hypothetical protein
MPPGIKRTTDEFISESTRKHKGLYDYSKVVYTNNLTEVVITCLQCGACFQQLPKCHLKGGGCAVCSFQNAARANILKSEQRFLTQIQHQDVEKRWDYSQVQFNGMNANITLTCNGCKNESTRTPYNHLHKFQPCRRQCFIQKTKSYEFNDVEKHTITQSPHIEITEEFKPFPENELYLVSSKGYLRNTQTGKIFKGSLDKISGYMYTALNKKKYSIHFMVARSFLPNPDNKPTVNHKNLNRTDNRLENLEWATAAEQNSHKNEMTEKTYKAHGNGTPILRMNDQGTVLETYATMMQAAKWILENVHKTETIGKNINEELKNISTALSARIKRNKKKLFVHGFLWAFEETEGNEGEMWKAITIESFEKKGFFVSNYGRIRDPNGKIKKKFSVAGGYFDLKIVKGGHHHKIHRLVAQHFLENPLLKQQVNHINGDKMNNQVTNLEWVTNQENVQHAYNNGLNKKVSPVLQYDKEGSEFIKEFKSIQDASNELGISNSSISACCRGKTKQTHGFHFKYKQ